MATGRYRVAIGVDVTSYVLALLGYEGYSSSSIRLLGVGDREYFGYTYGDATYVDVYAGIYDYCVTLRMIARMYAAYY